MSEHEEMSEYITESGTSATLTLQQSVIEGKATIETPSISASATASIALRTSAALALERPAMEGEATIETPSVSVSATASIAEEYVRGDSSTDIPDLIQYRLSRPKRVIIRAIKAIGKND